MEIKETKHHYYMKITGCFFLHAHYQEILIKIFKIFKANNLRFHLTRLDLAFTLNEPFQTIGELFKKVKLSDTMTRGIYEKKGKFTYISGFNSRFKVVGYSKEKQKKKKGEKYRKLFFYKYGLAETRFEFRLKSKTELIPLTEMIKEYPEQFFDTFSVYAKEKAKGRLLKLPRKLKKLLSM